MRCRKFHQNAVANILGYLFSFTLISMIMLISLMTTTSIVDQKKQEAAGLEAQNVANQISDAMIDTVTVSESLPYAQYYSLLNLPQKFAGLDYNVTLTNEEVTVSTTDGRIQKSTLNYNTENLQVDISGKLTSGEKSVSVAYSPSESLYKIDFGTGDSSASHSPVKAGYLFATGKTTIDATTPPEWYVVGSSANPQVGDRGGVVGVNDWSGFWHGVPVEPWVFQDGDHNWQNYPYQRPLYADPDLDGITPLFAGYGYAEWGGLYAFDEAGGEPFIFLDTNSNSDSIPWVYDAGDNFGYGNAFYYMPGAMGAYFPQTNIALLDPDGNGILAAPNPLSVPPRPGGLFAFDAHNIPYVYRDNDQVGSPNYGIYNTPNPGEGIPGDVVVYPSLNSYRAKYRIPIKLTRDSTQPLTDIPVEIVLSSQDIKMDELVGTNTYSCFFYDPDPNALKTLPWSIDYVKSYPSGYFSNVLNFNSINEHTVFRVNVSFDQDQTEKYVYLYYGLPVPSPNNKKAVTDFYYTPEGFNQWNKKYSTSKDEGAYSITCDGNDFIYVAGYKTEDQGNAKDWWLKQFTVNGYEYDQAAVAGTTDPGWNKTFGNTGVDDEAFSVTTYGSDVYVAGYKTISVGNADWWIKKFQRNGEEYPSWDKVIDGGNNGDDVARCVAVRSGNVYVAGYKTSSLGDKDWWIKKFDNNGNSPSGWNDIQFGGTGNDCAYALAIDNNNQYVYVVGSYYSDIGNGLDWCVKKFSASSGGEITDGWPKIINNPGDDVAYAVAVDDDDAVYVAGYYTTTNNGKDWLVMKFDEAGGEEWSKAFRGADGNVDDVAYSLELIRTNWGSYWHYSPGEIVSLDPDGNQWQATPTINQPGGLYALAPNGEPYTFAYPGADWTYNGESPIEYDPDHNEKDANPTSGDFAGLYTTDLLGNAYIFQDTIRNWKFNTGEHYKCVGGVNISPDVDYSYGGYYAVDTTDSHEPFTFKDLSTLYVTGYYTKGSNHQWNIKCLRPDGATISDSISDNGYSLQGSPYSLCIDSYSYWYAAGYIPGGLTDKDMMIVKGGPSAAWTNYDPRIWSCSYITYLANSCGDGLHSNTGYDHRIVSKDYELDLTTSDDVMYIVDLNINAHGRFSTSSWQYQLSACHTGLIIMSQDGKVNYNLPAKLSATSTNAYVLSVRDLLTSPQEPEKSQFNFSKYVNGVPQQSSQVVKSIPYLAAAGVKSTWGEGLLLRAYIYKEGGKLVIKGYLYHPTTFAPYPTEITFTEDLSSSFKKGRIGVVNMFHDDSIDRYGQTTVINSIRVLKTTKDPINVVVGASEGRNFGWIWPTVGGIKVNGEAEYNDASSLFPDPLYDDYVKVPIQYGVPNYDPVSGNLNDFSRFTFKKIKDPGRYMITLTTGGKDQADSCSLNYWYQERGQLPPDNIKSILIPETDANTVKRIHVILEIPEGKASGDFYLLFYKNEGGNPLDKPISSITLDRIERNIGFDVT